VADQDYLNRMPAVLQRWIAFAHDRAGIAPERSSEVLGLIEKWEPEYRSVVGSPRRHGPEALLERVGLLDPLEAEQDQDQP
jgi:hypothetical protein